MDGISVQRIFNGYLQNYKDGYNTRSLIQELSDRYAPFFPADGPVGLYVARQWDERSEVEEGELLGHSAVRDLVFSSFRFDNAKAVARDDWVA